MACQKEDPLLIPLLQEFIYFMNEKSVRDKIIQHSLRSYSHPGSWLGTWFVSLEDESSKHPKTLLLKKNNSFFQKKWVGKSLHQCLENKKEFFQKAKHPIFFTVCIQYELNKVHYVAFVYDPQQKTLTSFDPGVEVYHHGMKTIVPILRDIFHLLHFIPQPYLKQDQFSIGRCHEHQFKGKKMGIQFNGQNMDAFCQTWTVFFIHRYLIHGNADFVLDWCKIPPPKRESFILIAFIIPFLDYHPTLSQKYFDKVQTPKQEVMDKLMNHSHQCTFQIKSQKQDPKSSLWFF